MNETGSSGFLARTAMRVGFLHPLLVGFDGTPCSLPSRNIRDELRTTLLEKEKQNRGQRERRAYVLCCLLVEDDK